MLVSLSALSELSLRIGWLSDKLHGSNVRSWAAAVNEIVERAYSAEVRAREALLAIALFIVQRRESALVWALRQEARDQSLLGLERLLRESREDSIPPLEIEARVPDYGTGRELSVGARRSLARRPTRLQIERLILDPHPLVIEQLLGSPQLTEDDVVQIATRRPARLLALELLGKSTRWMSRPRVRLSMILNPGSPLGIALPLVSTCRREDLHLIVESTTLSKTIRTVAHELYCRLPPFDVPLGLERH